MTPHIPGPTDSRTRPTESAAGRPTFKDGVVSSPLLYEPDETTTAPWLLADRIARTADDPIIERKSGLGNTWVPVTAKAFGDEVARVAKGLIGMGLQPGDCVAIMCHTSYEWTLLDFAIASAGLISVPIYETDSADQIAWIIEDTGFKAAVAEDAALAGVIRDAEKIFAEQHEAPGITVLSLDQDAITTIAQSGQGVTAAQLDERRDAVKGSDVLTIIYTSGTTGKPKGVEIQHKVAIGLAHNGPEWMPDMLNTKRTRLLLFLPLAHSYARFLQYLSIAGCGVLGHSPNVRTLLPDLQGFAPSYILSVPRVLEKIYNAADAKAGSGAKLKTFRWAAKVAIQYSRALDTPSGPSRQLRAARALADRLVYRQIRSLLGVNAKYAISGGGPLGERLGHFYRGMGVSILEGYGLTETIGPACVNMDWLNKIGTVGPPVIGNSIRVGADGEIEVKGIGVFSHYHNNPEADAESFTDDGWYRTGDIGTIDENGWIRITGRKKELIVTAGGKNVAPAILEDRLRGHPLVSQVVVIGDGEPFISALITLDREMLPQWLKNHGLPDMDVVEASKDPQVLAALDKAVARTNKVVSPAESIRTYRVLTTDFTEANGLLTPSLKVKRNKVLEQFDDVVQDIYAKARLGAQS